MECTCRDTECTHQLLNDTTAAKCKKPATMILESDTTGKQSTYCYACGSDAVQLHPDLICDTDLGF